MVGERDDEKRIRRNDFLHDVADVGLERQDGTLDLSFRQLPYKRVGLFFEPPDSKAR
jgi:hypothetical protein